MVFVGAGTGTVGRMPAGLLGGGRFSGTLETTVAFGTKAQIGGPAENGQMPDRDPIIVAVKLTSDPPALVTTGRLERALNRDDVCAVRIDLDVEDTNVWDIQGD